MTVTGIHLLDAEHFVHLHARLLLTGQSGATGDQQVGIVGRDISAFTCAHRAVLAIFGGQILTGHGKAGYALGGWVAAHQLGAGLDGDDGAEIPQVDFAMIQFLRF